MSNRELPNKPLVEAILEVRWNLEGSLPGPVVDKNYRILLGSFFERLKEKYPFHEELPAAKIPDEFSPFVVKHRFRMKKGGWPLVQLGPGIFTVNATSDYSWTDFQPRVVEAYKYLLDSHPNKDEFKIKNLILRLIDAVDFEYSQEDAWKFLGDKLKINTSFPPNLFEDEEVDNLPASLSLQSSFKCKNPEGMITVKFATGQRAGKEALIWETTLESKGANFQDIIKGFENWLGSAHKITGDWFFKLVEGDLLRRFKGE